MTPRFNLYFAEDEADLLERGKKEIDNLSEFFKTALKDRLENPGRKKSRGNRTGPAGALRAKICRL